MAATLVAKAYSRSLSAAARLCGCSMSPSIWSPRGDLIVYSGPLVGGIIKLWPDWTEHPVDLPDVRVRINSTYRFVPDGSALGDPSRATAPTPDFWAVDFATRKTRQLTHLSNETLVRTFDITPDGKEMV